MFAPQPPILNTLSHRHTANHRACCCQHTCHRHTKYFISQALPTTGHAVANIPATGTQTAVPRSTNAADISLKTNECYSTNTVAIKVTTNDIFLEANECYGITAATDETTTIPVRSNECHGVAPATDAAQLDNTRETDEYDYVLRQ